MSLHQARGSRARRSVRRHRKRDTRVTRRWVDPATLKPKPEKKSAPRCIALSDTYWQLVAADEIARQAELQRQRERS